MNNILEKITFFIVCYKSTYIIDFCLRSLPKESKKIIIDNTNNEVLKKDIEGKYNNLEIILNKNNGYGSAANLAISKIETEYAFLLNPDALIQFEIISKFVDLSFLKKDNKDLIYIFGGIFFLIFLVKNLMIIFTLRFIYYFIDFKSKEDSM